MSELLPQRPCPVCAGSRRTAVYRQVFSQAVGGAFLSGYDVVACDDCGFGFADRVPGQGEFDLYYREASKYEHEHRGGEQSAEDLDRFASIAATIAPFVGDASARILEIGCSTGGLLARLRHDGFANVEGLDPSPACASAAQRLHGIPVRTGNLYAPPKGLAAADVVVLVGVLEHVVDLRLAVAKVRGFGRPGARVYVEVPDALRFADCLDAPYQQFSMEHVGFFSVATLKNLMEVMGFRTLSCTATERPHTPTSRMPVVCGVFAADGEAGNVVPDPATLVALREYVARSREADARLGLAIDRLVDSAEPVLVWGLGTLTRRLLASGGLARANIRAFVDSNPHYQGRDVDGVPVISPEEVRHRTETIVIASWVFQDEIEAQVRHGLGYRNDILRLASAERVAWKDES